MQTKNFSIFLIFWYFALHSIEYFVYLCIVNKTTKQGNKNSHFYRQKTDIMTLSTIVILSVAAALFSAQL